MGSVGLVFGLSEISPNGCDINEILDLQKSCINPTYPE